MKLLARVFPGEFSLILPIKIRCDLMHVKGHSTLVQFLLVQFYLNTVRVKHTATGRNVLNKAERDLTTHAVIRKTDAVSCQDQSAILHFRLATIVVGLSAEGDAANTLVYFLILVHRRLATAGVAEKSFCKITKTHFH